MNHAPLRPSAYAGDDSSEALSTDHVPVNHSLPFSESKKELIREFEVHYLRRLMATAGGNVSRAARLARMDRMYLHRLLVRHGLAASRDGGVTDQS